MLLSHPLDPWWRFFTAVIFTWPSSPTRWTAIWPVKHNIVTRFGKLADPIADKALTGMAFIGLSIIGELWWWVTITMLVREWGITVLRFVMLRYGVMAAGRGGKVKTVVQAVAVILYLLPLPGWAAPGGRGRDGDRPRPDRGDRTGLHPGGGRCAVGCGPQSAMSAGCRSSTRRS